MPTFLFEEHIIPPVNSRRFGKSLGVNLLPKKYKLCNFDCIYCECGWTLNEKKVKLPSRELIYEMLEKKLSELIEKQEHIDSITFAGNGEPSMHKDFLNIVKDTISLRDRYLPKVKITILSNGFFIGDKKVLQAYNLVDNPVLKLDAGTQEMLDIVNQPKGKKTIDYIVEQYKKMNDKIIIQSIFFKGTKYGIPFDNTNEDEIQKWIEKIKYISPRHVMIYSLDRDTPLSGLEKIPEEKLKKISLRLQNLGISSDVY